MVCASSCNEAHFTGISMAREAILYFPQLLYQGWFKTISFTTTHLTHYGFDAIFLFAMSIHFLYIDSSEATISFDFSSHLIHISISLLMFLSSISGRDWQLF